MLAVFNLLENETERKLAEAIYKKYKTEMYGAAYSILTNKADSEDAVMDSVCKIIDNIEKFEALDSVKTRSLVMIITRNAAINKYKYNKIRTCETLDEEESELYAEETPEEFFCNAEAYEELLAKIRTLEPIYKDVILLKYLYEYSTTDIAGMLGIAESTVRVRLMRAKNILRKKISGGEEK